MKLNSNVHASRLPRSLSERQLHYVEKVDTPCTRDTFEEIGPTLALHALTGPVLAKAELRDLRAEKMHRQHRSMTCQQAASLAEHKSPEAPAITALTELPWRSGENLRAALRVWAGVDSTAECFDAVLLGFRQGPASPRHAHGAALALQLHGAKQWQIQPPTPAHASPIELRLNAGEALFIPSGWRHATTNETDYTATLSVVLENS